ncbi:Basic-leucine zipper (bZIP) transcription factor [Macrophomina phaseolina MS6]|uniref:Basic-leucine zipper (BZIP) transcription factor n=1 Tax=Macrophomina phaseolina (strain MS6) TaxID=1126212 RepID=K2RYA5_MACPH|nr:Basic-leucine zipper (bZIP) transcription factor [Macrophomina phaseolina MS6]
MATTTENVFAFNPQPGPGTEIIDFVGSAALPTSFSSFFDNSFMAKLPFTQQACLGIEFEPRKDSHMQQDTVDPKILLRAIDRSISSNEVPSTFLEDKDCESNGLETEEASLRDGQIQSSPKGGNRPRSSNRSKKHSASTRSRSKRKADTEEARKRREEKLDKNRIAVNKCRQRKKNFMAKLDDLSRDLAARNRFLITEVENLGSTVLELKELVFQHVECGYAPIEEYVKAEANKLQSRATYHLVNCIPLNPTKILTESASGPG